MAKFIDKRGRIFGIINIFDLLVIFVLISTALLAVKWTQMAKDPSWVSVDTFYINCVVTTSMPEYMVDFVKEGDEMSNEDGMVVMRIEKVLSNELLPRAVFCSKGGEKIYFYTDQTRILTLKMKISAYEKKGEIYSCLSAMTIKIGDVFNFTTKKYSTMITIKKILERESN